MTKVIQEVQHPQYGLLQKFNIKTKNGNDMVTIGYVDSKNLLLRAPGYIITRDGECIIVPEQIKHADFFTNFLYRFKVLLLPCFICCLYLFLL